VVTNDPIVPPVTTTDTPTEVAVETAEAAVKEIDPPAWITPVLVIPPVTEVPIALTLEFALAVEVLATQPTDVNGAVVTSDYS
jgi:hypothetical protein